MLRILNINRKILPSAFFMSNKLLQPKFTTAKLSYGQGGQLSLNLKNRNYQIEFETVWEDHCMIEINGLTGQNSITINQSLENGRDQINDQMLEQKKDQTVYISIKIPEDYTFRGTVNGSIQQIKSKISNKLRCNKTSLNLIGPKRIFQWGTLQCPDIQLQNSEGAIYIKSLTFQQGNFIAKSFSSEKVLLSDKVRITTGHSINARSIVTYGNAIAILKTKFLQLQSISGKSEIQAQKVKIDRMWASPNGINMKVQQIQKLGIETGSGNIYSECDIDLSKISLGRLHKGKIFCIDSKTVKIV